MSIAIFKSSNSSSSSRSGTRSSSSCCRSRTGFQLDCRYLHRQAQSKQLGFIVLSAYHIAGWQSVVAASEVKSESSQILYPLSSISAICGLITSLCQTLGLLMGPNTLCRCRDKYALITYRKTIPISFFFCFLVLLPFVFPFATCVCLIPPPPHFAHLLKIKTDSWRRPHAAYLYH